MHQPSAPPYWSIGVLTAAVFTTLYVVAAAMAAVASGNSEFLFYIVVMLIMGASIALVHWRLRLTATLLWLLSIWGLMHMAGGLVPVPGSWPIDGDIRVLYSWWIIPREGAAADELGGWLKYDNIVHAFGYGVTAVLMWQVLRALVLKHTETIIKPTIGMMIVVVAAANGFGALNEIVEFSATLIAETNVGGYVNTGIDLVSNMAGSILAAAIIMYAEKNATSRAAS